MRKETPVFARVLYIFLIVAYMWRGMWDGVVLNGIVFLVLLPLGWFAYKHENLRGFDAFLVLVFCAFAAAFLGPSAFIATEGQVFGIDKLFHFLAGVALGWGAWLLLSPRISHRYICAALTVLAVGALAGWWEVFEWVLAFLPAPLTMVLQGLNDTMLDIVYVSVGGFIATMWLLHAKR